MSKEERVERWIETHREYLDAAAVLLGRATDEDALRNFLLKALDDDES